ncbi:MAG: glycosyltransferase [Deltaproteobacteria bacterium]|nr:MAG: glycosyltransferase [Deltaproteobacteria bacterium]
MESTEISIIIPTKNEEDNIEMCLEGIFSQDIDKKYEVIVIDSGSTDSTLDIIRKYPVKLFEIKPDEFDHGGTRNLGAEISRGKYIATIVADAYPANNDWLRWLTTPFTEDEEVAGVYSRQLPKNGCGPIEALYLNRWITGRNEKIVQRIQSRKIYQRLSPQHKRDLVNFDDVSSCRRRDVWERIPIAKNIWAEDVDWGRKVIEAGYKIVYEPRSVVHHSHRYTLPYAFKRHYVDQLISRKWFGYIYFKNKEEITRAARSNLVESYRAVKESEFSLLKKLRWWGLSPFLVCSQILGALTAAQEEEPEGIHFDFIKRLRVARIKRKDRERVLITSFTIDGRKENVLFENPNTEVTYKIRVPEEARLKFSLALNPKIWSPEKGEGVEFELRLDVSGKKEKIFSQFIDPKNKPEDRKWHDVEIDLHQYAEKRIAISFITRAENTDYGWAGWGRPRIVVPKHSWKERLKLKLASRIHERITRIPLRHT